MVSDVTDQAFTHLLLKSIQQLFIDHTMLHNSLTT